MNITIKSQEQGRRMKLFVQLRPPCQILKAQINNEIRDAKLNGYCQFQHE